MTSGIHALAPVVTRADVRLKDEWASRLVHLRVERATGLIGRATLRFADVGFELSAGDAFALGTAVSIAAPNDGKLIDGTVTGISLEQSGAGAPELVVVVDDAAYKLTRGTAVATYLNGTFTQILQKIATKHGLRADVQASSLTMEYLLQAGTDLAFLNTVTERLGYAWWVDEGPKLVAKPLAVASPAATVTLGEDMWDFTVRASGLRPTQVSMHGWDPDQQNNVTDLNPADVAGETPALVSKYTGAGPKGPLAVAKTAVADLRPLTSAEAKVLAGSYYDRWSSAAVVARGSTNITSKIKPGVTVKVKNAGPATGDYLVTSVEHLYDRSGSSTRFTTGSRQPSGLVDTLGPTAPDPGFLVAGLIVGIVTDSNDPDNAGRVKVRYTGLDGEIESPWARVVTLGGGNARGAVFHPEVNDEVLVGFEHGDTRRPVVLGGLYSKRNTLPDGNAYVADGKVNYRRIASRKNHIVELADGDAKNEQHILLKLGTAEHKLRLGADRFDIEVASGIPLTIKAGDAKFDISTSGDVTIEGNNVTIKANTKLDLEGSVSATLKGATQTQIQGAQISVKADGIANVEAGGPLALKGAVVAIN